MIPWFQWTTIQIGPIPIQVWGMFVSLGMLAALVIAAKRGKRFGLDRDHVLDQALWMIIFGFIFSRLFHVVFYEPAYFLAHPADIIKIWHGGLSSFGGVIGAIIGFFAFSWKKRQSVDVRWQIADLLAYSALFGWMIGRLGCVMIHDHMGRPCDSFISIQTPEGTPRLEMSILEILGLIPLALFFFFQRKKQKAKGWFLSILFIYYGVLRFILDFFRATDLAGSDTRYAGLTPAQYSAILMVAFGVFVFCGKCWKTNKKI